MSSVADPGDANYQPNIYMSNNVLYKPGQTLDNPANHIVIPFGGYNNIINIDPKLAVTPPQPKPFGMPSDTNIPDFRVLSNTNPVSPAYGRYSVPSTEYPYPTDLMDILGNAQPGPNNLAGAYAVPK